jgi:hypothetical protein
MFLSLLPSVAVMALDRRVLKKGDILCEMYADTCSDVSDDSEGEFLDSDSDSDVPTASTHKQFQPPTVVYTSDSDTNTEEEENSESESSDVWCETDKKSSSSLFLGTSGVNIVNDHSMSVAEVMNTIIGDDLIQLLTEQSNLYQRQNEQKWKMLPKTLKWSNITPEEMRKFMGLIVLMEQVRRESARDYRSIDPTISTPIFPQTMSRNRFESFWQAWHFSDNSQQTKTQGIFSKYFQCMSTLYRNLGQCTAQSKNCHLMKP